MPPCGNASPSPDAPAQHQLAFALVRMMPTFARNPLRRSSRCSLQPVIDTSIVPNSNDSPRVRPVSGRPRATSRSRRIEGGQLRAAPLRAAPGSAAVVASQLQQFAGRLGRDARAARPPPPSSSPAGSPGVENGASPSRLALRPAGAERCPLRIARRRSPREAPLPSRAAALRFASQPRTTRSAGLHPVARSVLQSLRDSAVPQTTSGRREPNSAAARLS